VNRAEAEAVIRADNERRFRASLPMTVTYTMFDDAESLGVRTPVIITLHADVSWTVGS
jgi:hypothetical protein